MLKRRAIALATLVGLGLVACAQIIGLSDLEEGRGLLDAGDGAGGEGGDGASEGGDEQVDPCSNGAQDGDETDVDCGGPTCGKCAKGKKCKVDSDCPKTCSDLGVCEGCAGVEMPDAGGACIDGTEVTVKAYAAFADKVRTGRPSQWCPATLVHPPDLAAQLAAGSGLPVRNVRWCSAVAFCQNRGARLCGPFADRDRTITEFANAAKDQWFAACSRGGQLAYPYGNNFESARCNDQGADAVWATGSGTNCKTLDPFDVYDMSGNVAEWEDACEDAGRDTSIARCRIRGGSFKSDPGGVACAADALQDINTPSPEIGFRCCE